MRKRLQTNAGVVQLARQQLTQYMLAHEVSGLRLSKSCGVGQTVIWRFLNGETKKITPKIAVVLDYAKIRATESIITHKKQESVDNGWFHQVLNEASADDEHVAFLLVRIIQVLGPVLQEHSARNGKGAL